MTGGGATGAVGGRGDGRRGYRVRWEVGRQQKGLQGPLGGGVIRGGATGTVGGRGDGRRAYRGRGEVG